MKKGNYEICFDDKKQMIQSFSVFGRELIGQQQSPLFRVRLRNQDGQIIDVDACSATVVETVADTDAYCQIRFSKFDDIPIKVEVTVSFLQAVSWRISVDNPTDLCVEFVDFPLLTVDNCLKGSGGDAKIFWGFNEGVTVDDISRRERSYFYSEEPAYPCKGTQAVFPGAIEMPFMAYYGKDYGLYLAAHDVDGHMKGIDFFRLEEGICFRFRLFSGLDFGEDFKMDYDIVMQPFIGDWYNAAEIYRNWFERNKAPEFCKIESNQCLPEWYAQSPVVITYPVRGKHDVDKMEPNKLFPYVNGMKHIKRLAEQLDSKIMALLMHWEGTAPWAPPIVWPPYGGEKLLREFADALHNEGHLLGLYCSGTGWTIQSCLVEDYNCQQQFDDEGLADVMCISPTGELQKSNICTAQRTGYDMCCSQAYTADILREQAEKMVKGGADYVQILDQNHGGTPWFCYSKKHGHPYAPGKWQVDAMKSILTGILHAANQDGRKILFGCESAAAETYIPYLLFSDNRYNICYQFGKPVPAYAYIYHEYVNNFSGNQVCANDFFDHIKSPDNILYRLAYSLAAGDMLTLVLNEDGNIAFNWGERRDILPPNQEQILEFVANGNAWRRYKGKPFLYTGKMKKPAKLDLPQDNEIMLSGNYIFYSDKLLTSRWEASDGRDAQFLINYNAVPVSCALHTEDGASYTLFTEPDGSGKTVKTKDGLIELMVPPLSTVMIEKNRGC